MAIASRIGRTFVDRTRVCVRRLCDIVRCWRISGCRWPLSKSYFRDRTNRENGFNKNTEIWFQKRSVLYNDDFLSLDRYKPDLSCYGASVFDIYTSKSTYTFWKFYSTTVFKFCSSKNVHVLRLCNLDVIHNAYRYVISVGISVRVSWRTKSRVGSHNVMNALRTFWRTKVKRNIT